MVSKKSRSEVRVNKHRKLRNRFSGTAERPRLAVFRSNNQRGGDAAELGYVESC